jgi:intein/homing endonuclease
VELTLKKEDEEHIRKFQNTVKHNGELDDRHIELNQKHFLATRLSLCSKRMVEDLIKLGCFENKSLELKFPTEKQVPNKLVHHFMRGYFDGDGYIGTTREGKDLRFSLLGTYDFLSMYEKKLNVNIKEPKLTKSKAFFVQHGGNLQVKKIYDYLYKNATLYLERKRNVFFAVLGQNSQKTQDD